MKDGRVKIYLHLFVNTNGVILKIQMSFLNKIFGAKDRDSSIGAILYPDRILIETQDKVRAGLRVTTDQITFLDVEVNDNELGKVVIKHLNLSRTGVRDPKQKDHKIYEEKYKKATGLKTIKAQMKDAKYVGVIKKESVILFEPTINGGSTGPNRGYRDVENASISIASNSSAKEIGETLRASWIKCK